MFRWLRRWLARRDVTRDVLAYPSAQERQRIRQRLEADHWRRLHEIRERAQQLRRDQALRTRPAGQSLTPFSTYDQPGVWPSLGETHSGEGRNASVFDGGESGGGGASGAWADAGSCSSGDAGGSGGDCGGGSSD